MIQIDLPEEVINQLRMTAIHSKLPIEQIVADIVKSYYASRNKD